MNKCVYIWREVRGFFHFDIIPALLGDRRDGHLPNFCEFVRRALRRSHGHPFVRGALRSTAHTPRKKKIPYIYCILYETIFFLLESAFSYICKCIKESVECGGGGGIFEFYFYFIFIFRHT
jgi:hypothetical protein